MGIYIYIYILFFITIIYNYCEFQEWLVMTRGIAYWVSPESNVMKPQLLY